METRDPRSSTSLRLARAWYVVIGAGALLLTGGEIMGDLTPGAVVDVPNLAAGLAVGVFALAAAAWVVSLVPYQRVIAWLGIAAGFAPFGVLLWITANTASPDAILLAAVPTVLAAAAGARMVMARLAA